MNWSPLADKVNSILTRKSLLNKGDKVLLAVSGGMDSIVMFSVFLELQEKWNFELVLGHINHNLRPADDKKEAQLCQNLALKNELLYLEKKIDLSAKEAQEEYAQESGQHASLESLARNARYKVFEKWSQVHHFNAVCSAHHLNDQAETVLYRMLTGSGIKGLKGIPEIRDLYKRPFLEISREEIESYAKDNKLEYYEDPSNKEQRFARNKIRHSIIPALKGMGFPDLEKTLASSANSLDEAVSALDHYTESTYLEAVVITEKQLKIKTDELEQHPLFIQKQIIRQVFKEAFQVVAHISDNQLEQILSFIHHADHGNSFDLYNVTLLKDRKFIVSPFETGDSKMDSFECKPGKYDIAGRKIQVEIKAVKKDMIPFDKHLAYFSISLLGKELTFRSWENGDSMTIFGAGKNKKVSDILKDEKVSVLEKQTYPVLLANECIIWIPGVKRSNEFVVDKDDFEMIALTYI
jgi:tRNA(Ile)-lysidine synthase